MEYLGAGDCAVEYRTIGIAADDCGGCDAGAFGTADVS